MFGLGVGEILLILALALIFIGPERLPDLARSLAKGYAEFRRSFDEVKNTIEKDLRSLNVEEQLRQGKGFNLDEVYKAPWANEPGKLTPPGSLQAEEAEISEVNAPAEEKKDKAPEKQKIAGADHHES